MNIVKSIRHEATAEGMSGEGKVVAVTGASGFIASWLAKLLLQCAYTVRATVRDPNDPEKTEHLLALEGAKERLHLFKAELMKEGSFDDAFDGCEAVFHTASPTFITPSSDPQAELIDPAVKGTLNVLRSCARADSIKRVVLTSSMATVVFNGKPLTPETVVDETWFSEPVICENMKLWYMLAKTLAEKAAWKFANENEMDMVTLHPGLVIGPLLQPNLNSSVEVILDIVHGKKSLFGTIYRFVDVRDIALAHLRAYEISSASGRYCVVNRILTLKGTLEILHSLFPNSNLPRAVDEVVDLNEPNFRISREKAKSLGITFTPVEESLRDTVESLREKGLLSI